jgi:hypothetical protein
MNKLILILSVLILSGCSESDEMKIKRFNDGKQLLCNANPFYFGVVISNKTYKYSENLNRFYNDNGDHYQSKNCE